MDRKARHEQFVTGYAGGSVTEIYLLTFTCILSIVCYHFISSNLSPGLQSYIAEFVFNWAIILAATTVYARNLAKLVTILLVTTVIAYIVRNDGKKQDAKKLNSRKKAAKREVPKSDALVAYRPFLTIYRSEMMVLTITAILAVDFPIFPRAFVKTETWGTSLMDLGVGSFVFSMGIVSARKELKMPNSPFFVEVKASVKQTLKVLILGVIRFVSVKLLDYQEHVSEYGVHWNFFFTLGLLPLSFTFLNRLYCPGGLTVKAFLLAFGYELVLKNTGLQEWALIAPRTDLLSSNKEGIVSFAGYLAIFAFGYKLGAYLMSPRISYPQILVKLGVWTVIAQLLFSILRVATEPSRRIANLPYICWVVCFNSGCLVVYSAAEYFLGVLPSKSYNGVNKYGETIFVLGNLLTGLVNLSIDTLTVSSIQSFLILLGYQATVTIIVRLFFQ